MNQHELTPDSWEQVLPIVYQQLKHLARKVKSNHRSGETLNTTALVHDVYLKIKNHGNLSVQGRKHFYRLAAQAMRQILIDAARAKLTSKRQTQLVEWDDEFSVILMEKPGTTAPELLAIDEALNALKQVDEKLVQIVELHFFAGYGFAEIAKIMDISESTVYREWKKARAWLYAQLS
ncbi:MAG: sigma-70 family RNA polymerase sigma factor [Xanthomonadales bacterium]|nr:sigma-70 family RNA polymerase sigma factor [Xanthomonadales bacterium]